MSDAINAFLLIFAGLFPIVNPVGCAPLFLGMTSTCTQEERHVLARGVAINSFFLLVGSLFIGSYVLEFFGITLPVVRIAGGLVVCAFSWKLLHASESAAPDGMGALHHDPLAASDRRPPRSASDAFYPLTMPLTVGPGSISVAVTLGSQRPKAVGNLLELLLLGGAAIAGIAAISLAVYLCYRFGERVLGFLGESGTNVVVRLFAFIVLCIGVQIVWGGWRALTGA